MERLTVATLISLAAGSIAAAKHPNILYIIPLPAYEDMEANSVEIYVDGQLGGSGWVERDTGLVVTAAHVVIHWKTCLLRDAKGNKIEAKTIATDLGHDLAILRPATPIDAPGFVLAKAMPIVGADAFLFGAPIFRHGIMVKGALARPTPAFEWNPTIERPMEIFYYTAPSPIGTSGGPWINDRGEACGVQSGMMSRQPGSSSGIAFVTGLAPIRALLASRKNTPEPFLGAVVEEFGEQGPDFHKTKPEDVEGVLVKILRPGYRGSELLQQGDIITQIAGSTPTLRDDYYRAVRDAPDGPIAVTVLRDGESLSLILPDIAEEEEEDVLPSPARQ